MKHVTLGLLIPSPIIAGGIETLIGSIADINATIYTLTKNDIIHEIQSFKPSLMIVDPLWTPVELLDSVREASVVRLRIAAVYCSALPPDIVKGFDETISIYDSVDSIAQILGRMTDGDDNDDERSCELSPREKAVVIGVVKQMSNKEIAAELHVSVNTVMTHRRNIAGKLKIHSPAGLTIYAIVNKLVKLDEIKPLV